MSEDCSDTSDSFELFARIEKQFASCVCNCVCSRLFDNFSDDLIVPVDNNDDIRVNAVLSAMATENSVFVDLLRKFAVAFELLTFAVFLGEAEVLLNARFELSQGRVEREVIRQSRDGVGLSASGLFRAHDAGLKR
jgi:hypothetical protein